MSREGWSARDANADVPLRPVQRMRLELEDMRTRARQAKTLADIRCAAERSAIDRYPLTSRRAIIAASTELQEVAHLLRQPPTSVPGVARVRLLLTAAGSPLYGTDGFALREELHQIRLLLQRGQPARDGGPESPPRVMSPVRRLR